MKIKNKLGSSLLILPIYHICLALSISYALNSSVVDGVIIIVKVYLIGLSDILSSSLVGNVLIIIYNRLVSPVLDILYANIALLEDHISNLVMLQVSADGLIDELLSADISQILYVAIVIGAFIGLNFIVIYLLNKHFSAIIFFSQKFARMSIIIACAIEAIKYTIFIAEKALLPITDGLVPKLSLAGIDRTIFWLLIIISAVVAINAIGKWVTCWAILGITFELLNINTSLYVRNISSEFAVMIAGANSLAILIKNMSACGTFYADILSSIAVLGLAAWFVCILQSVQIRYGVSQTLSLLRLIISVIDRINTGLDQLFLEVMYRVAGFIVVLMWHICIVGIGLTLIICVADSYTVFQCGALIIFASKLHLSYKVITNFYKPGVFSRANELEEALTYAAPYLAFLNSLIWVVSVQPEFDADLWLYYMLFCAGLYAAAGLWAECMDQYPDEAEILKSLSDRTRDLQDGIQGKYKFKFPDENEASDADSKTMGSTLYLAPPCTPDRIRGSKTRQDKRLKRR